MKNKSILLYVLIIGLLSSCQTKPEEEETPNYNTFKAEFVDYFKLSDYFSSLDYVFLEESPDGLFINADKIIHFQDRWYILDKELMVILCFSEDGKFIFRIHTVGKGPGEYQVLQNIMIHKQKKELWAQCMRIEKNLVYNLDGKLIREDISDRSVTDIIQMNETEVIAFDEDNHHFSSKDSLTCGVYRFGNKFRKRDQLFNMPQGTSYYAFNNGNNFSMHNDSCFFLSASDSLMCFSQDLEKDPTVAGIFDFGKYHLSQKSKHLSDNLRYSDEVFESGKIQWKSNLIVTSQNIFLDIGFDRMVWFGIIDRENSKFRISQGLMNDLNSKIFVFPSQKISENELVGYISADYLLAYKESLSQISEEELKKESTKELIAFIERGLESSGNILVISKIKTH